MSTSSSRLMTPGRGLILFASIFIAVGSFVADWSETHVLNPRWPPHARFHNGQTMTMSLLLLALVSYLLLTPALFGRVADRTAFAQRNSAWIAALVGSMYCVAGLSAIWYPGTAWKDPEFDQLDGVQLYVFGGQLVVNWLGYYLECRRLSSVSKED